MNKQRNTDSSSFMHLHYRGCRSRGNPWCPQHEEPIAALEHHRASPATSEPREQTSCRTAEALLHHAWRIREKAQDRIGERGEE